MLHAVNSVAADAWNSTNWLLVIGFLSETVQVNQRVEPPQLYHWLIVILQKGMQYFEIRWDYCPIKNEATLATDRVKIIYLQLFDS